MYCTLRGVIAATDVTDEMLMTADYGSGCIRWELPEDCVNHPGTECVVRTQIRLFNRWKLRIRTLTAVWKCRLIWSSGSGDVKRDIPCDFALASFVHMMRECTSLPSQQISIGHKLLISINLAHEKNGMG